MEEITALGRILILYYPHVSSILLLLNGFHIMCVYTFTGVPVLPIQ